MEKASAHAATYSGMIVVEAGTLNIVFDSTGIDNDDDVELIIVTRKEEIRGEGPVTYHGNV